MHTPRPTFILVRSIAALIAASSTSLALDNIWTGATSTDWNTDANWSDPHGFGSPHVPNNGPGHPGDEDAVINTSTGNIATITANLVANPRDIKVGIFGGQTGILNHSAGTASIGGWFFVGRDGGTGTYNQTGGAMSASRVLVGTVAGSVGTVNQSGGTTASTSDRFLVGTDGGTGTYNLANTAGVGGPLTGFATGTGSISVGGGGRLYVGGVENPQGGIGTMNINTTGTITVPNDLAIGSGGGTGIDEHRFGTMTTGGWNFIGRPGDNTPGGNGTLNMSGGTLTNTGRTYVGHDGYHRQDRADRERRLHQRQQRAVHRRRRRWQQRHHYREWTHRAIRFQCRRTVDRPGAGGMAP